MSLTVDVTVTPTAGGAFRCQGTLAEPERTTNPSEAVAAWLDSISPAELERVALERQSGFTGSYTAVLLGVLGEMARGHP